VSVSFNRNLFKAFSGMFGFEIQDTVIGFDRECCIKKPTRQSLIQEDSSAYKLMHVMA